MNLSPFSPKVHSALWPQFWSQLVNLFPEPSTRHGVLMQFKLWLT
jgi:hypothetical protein